MPHWQFADIIANGIRIHYYRTGGDKPPLVLSHGFGDDGRCWTRVARALEADYDVILPDARGHGRSDAPDGGYSSTDRAADLAAFIRGLGLERPAIGGHSMGAGTSLHCAALHPELVACAILEDPGLRDIGSAGDLDAMMVRRRREIERDRSRTVDEIVAEGRARHPTWDDVEFGPWAEAKRRVSPHAVATREQPEAMDWRDAFARSSCPMLLLTSDPALGGIVTREAAEDARRAKPDLRVVHVPGVGHSIRREAFERFVTECRAFLREVYAA